MGASKAEGPWNKSGNTAGSIYGPHFSSSGPDVHPAPDPCILQPILYVANANVFDQTHKSPLSGSSLGTLCLMKGTAFHTVEQV